MNDQRGRRLKAAARLGQSGSKLSAVRDEVIHEHATDLYETQSIESSREDLQTRERFELAQTIGVRFDKRSAPELP